MKLHLGYLIMFIGAWNVLETEANTDNPGIYLKVTSKIYGGKNEERGAHPWQALILTKEPVPRGHGYRMRLCGGVLVKKNWVLTAANCVRTNQLYMIYINKFTILVGWNQKYRCLGEVNSHSYMSGGKTKIFFGVYNKTNRIEGGRTEHSVKRKVYHPCWNKNGEILTGYNLVLLELAKPEKNYQPVCLDPPSTHDWSTIEKGGSLRGCVATGYGKTETGETAQVLQQVRFSNTSHAACKAAYGSYVTKKHICAYDVTKTIEDTCKGDMGGPLLCRSEKKNCKGFYLAGVTLGGSSQCGVPNRPGIYTATHPHLPWIKSVTGGVPMKRAITCPKVKPKRKVHGDGINYFRKTFDFKSII